MHPETKKEQTLSFFTSWSKIYDWRIFQFWFRRFYTPALRELHAHTNFVLLDVSCGTGEFLNAVSKKSPHAVLHGSDFTPDMVARAKQKLGQRAQVQQADVHKLPYGSMYDYVVSTESFHHYYSQEEALKEMVRVAKYGGKIIVVDINFFFPFIHRLTERFEPGCVKVNSKRDMRYLFHHAGLKNIKQRRNFFFAVMTTGTK